MEGHRGVPKRDVRTVQRWEKLDGLPIYRHGPGRLGGVYAYKPELDGWWDSVRARIENTPASAVAAGDAPASSPDAPRARDSHWRSRPIVWVTFALATLLVGASLAVIVFRWQTDRAPGNAGARLGFQARDWVLIARFENRTGEAALDGVLEYALERELSNSRFVNVVPRERIEDTLRLMAKPPDTVIDATVGREICLRDGGIRALITGRVERIGRRYALSGTVVDPSLGMAVSTINEEADDPNQVLRSVRTLAEGLRARLGEALDSIHTADQKLERASTPSLRALRLYSQALEFEHRFNWAAAADLLRQAIAEDATFATAEIHLAWALRNQAQDAARYLPHAERALDLSARADLPERSLIRGSYLTMVGRDAEAVAVYEGLLAIHPDHFWAVNNLVAAYRRVGSAEQAIPYLVRLANLRPNDLRAQTTAALELAVAGDLRQGSEIARGARRRLSTASTEEPAFSSLALIVAHARWLSGDAEGALGDVRAVAGLLGALPAAPQAALAFRVGNSYLAFGRVSDAVGALGYMQGPAVPAYLASVAFARGDRPS